MTQMKQIASVCVLGDVVGSRRVADRQHLHATLQKALNSANARWHHNFRVTVGDEFQGICATVGEAVSSTLQLRVAMLPAYDVRFGVARGATEVLADSPRVEDGPGWWAARSAIEEAKELAEGALSETRTRFRDPGARDLEAAVNAALTAQDLLVSRLDDTGLSVLRGMLNEHSQRDLAEMLGISASAISQRVRRNGIAAVLAIANDLSRLT